MGDAIVSLQGVSKSFRRHGSGRGWKRMRSRLRLRARSRFDVSMDSFEALHDIGFQVHRGEALGIMGPNGAGKSTLLKLLAGILRSDCGQLHVRGRVSSLIELGAGFHGDLTGRENIYLNGTILGMRRAEIHSRLASIVDFAGVADFLDVPVKRYSSGMHARLGFAIAAHTNPDVLLVDEVLSVGDAVYRIRCLARMRELVQQGATLILVSHDLEQIREACLRSILLEQGRLIFNGPTDQASRLYMQSVSRSLCHRPADLRYMDMLTSARVRELIHYNAAGAEISNFIPTEPITISVQCEGIPVGAHLTFELNLRGLQCGQIVSLNSARDGFHCVGSSRIATITVHLQSLPISAGNYFWNVRVWDASSGRLLIDTPFQYPLQIQSSSASSGNVYCERTWSQEAETVTCNGMRSGIALGRHRENADAYLPVG